MLLLLLLLQELPEDYNCPICGATKEKFESRVKVRGSAGMSARMLLSVQWQLSQHTHPSRTDSVW
jgi:hypothetical protein